MMKFGESAARIGRSDGSVAGFVGGTTEFYERCEGYGGYGNREVSRDDANKKMQRDPLVTRHDKATTERFDSVEKQIAMMGTEANLEDSSPVMGIVTVPVFPDVGLRQWISWMEHYFARKGLTDFEKLHMAYGFIVDEPEWYIDSLEPINSWKEMKETLLLKFGEDDDPEKIILKARYARGQEAFMIWEAEKRPDSGLCSDDSGDVTFTDESTSHKPIVHEIKVVRNCSPPEVIQPAFDSEMVRERDVVKQTIEIAEVSVQSETILEKDCFAETDHEDELSKEKEAEQVLKFPYMADPEEILVAEMSLKGSNLVKTMALEAVDNVSMSSTDDLVPCCLSPTIMLQKASGSETEEEAVVRVTGDKEFPLEQNMDLLQELELVQKIYSPPPVVSDSVAFLGGAVIIDAKNVEVACVHQLCDPKFLPFQTEQKKCAKTWKFKFKTETVSQMVRRQWVQLKVKPSLKEVRDVDVAHVYLVPVQRLSDVTLLTSEQQILEPRRKCYKSWRFKYKPEQAEMKEQHTQLHGLRVWIEQLRAVGKTMIPRQFKKVADMSHQLINRSFLPRHILEQSKLKRKNIWQKQKLWLIVMRKILQALTQLLVGNTKFQVKHKWRFKQFQVLVLARVACGLTELQPYEFFPGSSPIFSFISSLWASLISRDGVYTRFMMCGLVEVELIWWFANSKQVYCSQENDWKTMGRNRLSRHEMVQVEKHTSLKDKSSLVIHVKRHLLMGLLQQKQQWEKLYKSRMFKYKERLKQGGKLKWQKQIRIEAGLFNAYGPVMLSSQWRLHISL